MRILPSSLLLTALVAIRNVADAQVGNPCYLMYVWNEGFFGTVDTIHDTGPRKSSNTGSGGRVQPRNENDIKMAQSSKKDVDGVLGGGKT